MPTVELNITGGSYQSKSRPLSSQSTINFYPEVQDDPFVLSNFVLQPTPGYKLWSNGGTGADRGMLEHKGVLYKVSGTNLYSVDNAGVHTSLGTIPGVTQCILRGFSDNVLIATGLGTVYQYDGALTEITDATLETPLTVDVLNRRAIYDGDDDRFMVSSTADATTISALDIAEAETQADNLVRPYVFKQRIYMFGDKTTEPWWNSDQGRPPHDRIEGGIITVGLAARMSVSHNDRFMYFLGDDRIVYRILDVGQFERVSTIPLSTAFEGYSTVSDAIGFCYTYNGQNFYQLSFPLEDITWNYSESVGGWFQTARSNTKKRSIANTYAYAYGKHLVADYRSANIYEWDNNTYDENGSPLTRERTTGPIHGGLIGAPGKEIEFNRFELLVEQGVGLISGQGSDPMVMLQISVDGGRTFGTEYWGQVGKSGEFMRKLEWRGLGRFAEGMVRIKTSDPVFYSIHTANMDITVVD